MKKTTGNPRPDPWIPGGGIDRTGAKKYAKFLLLVISHKTGTLPICDMNSSGFRLNKAISD